MRQILLDHLMNLYYAEHRIAELLPRLADATNSASVREEYRSHFEASMRRILQIEKTCREMGVEARRCPNGIEPLARTTERVMAQRDSQPGKDIQLLASVQKMLHYGLAGYGTAKLCADAAQLTHVADLLQRTIDTQRRAVDRLWQLMERRVAVP